MFRSMDATALTSMRLVAKWANDPAHSYRQSAIADFLGKADSELVAYDHAHKVTVVTHEQPAPQAMKEIKIPDACKALDVDYINTFTMLRAEHARFVLGAN